jgi:hypothetical protein
VAGSLSEAERIDALAEPEAMGSGHLCDETSRNAPQGAGFGSEAGFGLTLEDRLGFGAEVWTYVG